MLVATRDPLPHDGAQDAPRPRPRAGLGRQAGGAARFITVLQVAGSLLAIPVGLVSAYSMYRANFSVESTCQGLRANIVGMIDKQIDAGTRRMLVGRDVESFEKTCATVDPDAVAAFRKLLAVEKAPVAARAATSAKEVTKEVPRKVELRPSVSAKPAAAAVPVPPPAPAKAAAAAEPAAQEAHEAPVSDTKWLAAVRGALVAQPAERERAAAPATPAANPATTASIPAAAPASVPAPPEASAATLVPAEAPAAAPALPPPTAIASAPPQAPAADHPVPPAAIPEIVDGAPGHKGGWLGKIPFVGQVLAR
ncbi:MAG TPA: hypothetical protein VG986_03480 [Pseudolabrys sp.]|nr:hypothetical protein [Pseudolabrys sp.]